MGRIYRCSNPCTQYPGQADCIYSVGKTGTDEKENADQSEPFDLGSTASESAFCVSWIFFGSKPFSQTNKFLEAHGVEPIDWQIDEL